MIVVKPETLAFRCLHILTSEDDNWTTDNLTVRLFPYPPPPVCQMQGIPQAQRGAAYAAWRQAYTKHKERQAEVQSVRRQQVSRALGRLQEHGLVERRGAPRISEWFLASVQRHELHNAVWRAHPQWPRRVPGLKRHGVLLCALMVEKPPSTVKELLGAKPTTKQESAYADLVKWGVIIAPNQRHATPKGFEFMRKYHENHKTE